VQRNQILRHDLQEFSKSLRIYTFNVEIDTMWPKQETTVSGEIILKGGFKEKAFPALGL